MIQLKKTAVEKTDEEVEAHKERPADEFTMEQLRFIANSITEMFQLEEDYPSNHHDGHVPILDLKVWVEAGDLSARRTDYSQGVDDQEQSSQGMDNLPPEAETPED